MTTPVRDRPRKDRYGRQKVVIFDWDDTLAYEAWPEVGDFIPGHLELLQGVLDDGFRPAIQTCRLHSLKTDLVTPRDKAEWLLELGRLRKRLSDAGFPHVPILIQDKHPAAAYVDDKAVNLRPGDNPRKKLREILKVARG